MFGAKVRSVRLRFSGQPVGWRLWEPQMPFAKPLHALAVLALLCGPLAPAAWAYDLNSKSEHNVDASGLALRGYDPVAYFTDGKPVLGQAKFTASHDGASYRFASAEHRQMFLAEPEKYVPAYGGFCAIGAAYAKKANGDPLVWRIVEGKLYLNVTEGAEKAWLEDVPGNVSRANENWSKIKDKTPGEL